jgi:hypothetical protein
MTSALLAVIALGMTAIAYGFKLDYLKFISAVMWFILGFWMAGNITLVNNLQWVFLPLFGFGIMITMLLTTIHGMALASEAKRTTLKQQLATAPYTDDDEFSDEDNEIEKERKFYEKKWQPSQTKRSKRRSQLLR